MIQGNVHMLSRSRSCRYVLHLHAAAAGAIVHAWTQWPYMTAKLLNKALHFLCTTMKGRTRLQASISVYTSQQGDRTAALRCLPVRCQQLAMFCACSACVHPCCHSLIKLDFRLVPTCRMCHMLLCVGLQAMSHNGKTVTYGLFMTELTFVRG